MNKFKRIWKFMNDGKAIMPHSDFDSAFKEDTELSGFRELFYGKVFDIPLKDIYKSPRRPSQPDKVERFSESLRNGDVLPPVKVLVAPPLGDADKTWFTVLDGRGRLETAETMGYDKVGVVITDIDPKTEREYQGFAEYLEQSL